MIKQILLLGLISIFNISILQAQITQPEIEIDLDGLNMENLNQSERILIQILIEKEVKKLEKELEQLKADKRFGRISATQYEERKQIASDKITDKIGKSIDILINPEYFSSYSYDTTDSIDYIESDISDTSHYRKESSQYQYVKFKTNLYRNKKLEIDERTEIYIRLKEKNTSCKTDSVDQRLKARTSISGNIGFGFTNWMDKDNKRYDDPTKKLSGNSSWYYEIGLKANSYLDKKHVKTSIDYGITLISRYYHFNNKNYSINGDNNGIATLENVQITESVFSQTSLEFPLSITHRFTNSTKERLTISAGVYGGFHLRSRQKIKYSVNNNDYKAKWFSGFNSNPFYSGVKASIGYNSVYLIARYNFSKLFKSSSDIEVYPYSIGLSFGL